MPSRHSCSTTRERSPSFGHIGTCRAHARALSAMSRDHSRGAAGPGRRFAPPAFANAPRAAAISFPDGDVLVAARLAQPSCYTLLSSYANLVPRPAYVPNGEDRAWGRRLAKRFGLEPHFDDRGFTIAVKSRKPTCVPILDASAVKATGGSKIVSLIGELDATRGKAMIAFGWAVAEELAAGSYVAAY